MLTEAASTSPAVAVQLVPDASVFEQSAVGRGDLLVEDQHELEKLISQIRSSLKGARLREFLDVAIGIAISFTTSHAGTSPAFFPILSHQSFSTYRPPDSIILKQDQLSPLGLSSFLAFLRDMAVPRRPLVRLMYHDRERCLALGAKLAGLAKFHERFGGVMRTINLAATPADDHEVVSFALDGNHLPNLSRIENLDESLTAGWISAKSAKIYDHPNNAESKIRKAILEVQRRYATSESSERKFWLTLIVQLQLDLAYILDEAANESALALNIARELGDNGLVAHCLRFANQFLGSFGEAAAALEESCRRFSQIPENSELWPMYASSSFGALQNANTTALINSRAVPDPARFRSDFDAAIALHPTYGNLAMLGNAAAMAQLCLGNHSAAERVFEDALVQNAHAIDRMNIEVNQICNQYLWSGDFDRGQFLNICQNLCSYDFGKNW